MLLSTHEALKRAVEKKADRGGQVASGLKARFPPTYATPSDDEIKSAVVDVLAWIPGLDSRCIKAAVEGGTVTLEGYAPYHWHRAKAEELVSALRGIAEVRNEVIVTPTQKIEDELIAKNINGELERARLLDESNVEVTVQDGVVTLSGKVGITLSSWRTERFARIAPGVRDVDNQLDVKYL